MEQSNETLSNAVQMEHHELLKRELIHRLTEIDELKTTLIAVYEKLANTEKELSFYQEEISILRHELITLKSIQ